MTSGVIRMSSSSRRPCRSTSWPAANGIRCVKPSSATLSPSRTSVAIASLRLVASAIRAQYVKGTDFSPPGWRDGLGGGSAPDLFGHVHDQAQLVGLLLSRQDIPLDGR